MIWFRPQRFESRARTAGSLARPPALATELLDQGRQNPGVLSGESVGRKERASVARRAPMSGSRALSCLISIATVPRGFDRST